MVHELFAASEKRPEAAIVNTSSIFGLLSVPNQSIYHVGKYGVRGFTESLALEMKMEKSNVEVYSVHPGHIGTNIANESKKWKNLNLILKNKMMGQIFWIKSKIC